MVGLTALPADQHPDGAKKLRHGVKEAAPVNQEQRLGQSVVAGQHRHVVAVLGPCTRFHAARFDLVDNIVVKQRREVYQFHGRGQFDQGRRHLTPVGAVRCHRREDE